MTKRAELSAKGAMSRLKKSFEPGYMFYRYEGELLVAKQASKDRKREGARQDQFRYVYDEQGRLVAQFEFDPYFFPTKKYAFFFGVKIHVSINLGTEQDLKGYVS